MLKVDISDQNRVRRLLPRYFLEWFWVLEDYNIRILIQIQASVLMISKCSEADFR